jgi:hypothetical protein
LLSRGSYPLSHSTNLPGGLLSRKNNDPTGHKILCGHHVKRETECCAYILCRMEGGGHSLDGMKIKTLFLGRNRTGFMPWTQPAKETIRTQDQVWPRCTSGHVSAVIALTDVLNVSVSRVRNPCRAAESLLFTGCAPAPHPSASLYAVTYIAHHPMVCHL